MRVEYRKIFLLSIFYLYLLFFQHGYGQDSFVITRLKYSGGGDWYNDPSSLINLCEFIRKETLVQLDCHQHFITISDEAFFTIPFLFLTGHGRISISDHESERLRTYLLNGGFLYADDDYGMDTYFKAMMKKVFPERDMVELPFDHGIYSVHFSFDNGLPKIHEHDNKPAQGFGIFDDNQRLMVFYTYETNLSDGWADEKVHSNTPAKRLAALRMGTNILIWALLN